MDLDKNKSPGPIHRLKNYPSLPLRRNEAKDLFQAAPTPLLLPRFPHHFHPSLRHHDGYAYVRLVEEDFLEGSFVIFVV